MANSIFDFGLVCMHSPIFSCTWYIRGPIRTYNVDLNGQVVIITGSSAGIGRESAKVLAQHGATIVFACRNKEKTEQVIQTMTQQTKNPNLHFITLDTSDYDSVREFAVQFKARYNKLNILINNAGTANQLKAFNKQGHEQIFSTNHLGHFLLTDLLMDLIIKTPQARVINVSSRSHERVKSTPSFQNCLDGNLSRPLARYELSKYCNVLFTHALQEKFDNRKIEAKAVVLHPGLVRTEIFNKSIDNSVLNKIIMRILLHSVLYFRGLNEVEGAMTTIYTSLMPFTELSPAGYYQKNMLSSCSKLARTSNQQKELWKFSESTLGIRTSI